jgi:hypothetical protein
VRRLLPLLVLLAACTGGGGIRDLDAAPDGATPEEDAGVACPASGVSKGPWALAMTETSVTLRWEACRAGASGGVTLVPEGGGAPVRADASEKSVNVTLAVRAVLAPSAPADVAGTFWMREARVSGLAVGTCYRWTLDADASAKGRVCTARAPGQPFRFLAVGDTNPSLNDSTARVLSHVLPESPDFVTHGGDIQYYDSKLETWASWFPLMQPLLRSGAMMVAIGNHEFEIDGEYDQYVKRFFGGAGEGGLSPGNSDEHYRFSTGGVWFFALDTEIPMQKGSPQWQWFESTIADTKSKPGYRFSVVFLHRPFWTCGDSDDHPDWLADWTPLFDQLGVPLVLQHHMHGYERFETMGRTFVTTGGGGGLIKSVGENLARPYCGARVIAAPAYEGLVVDVATGKLSGRAIDRDGATLDTFEHAVP